MGDQRDVERRASVRSVRTATLSIGPMRLRESATRSPCRVVLIAGETPRIRRDKSTSPAGGGPSKLHSCCCRNECHPCSPSARERGILGTTLQQVKRQLSSSGKISRYPENAGSLRC